MLSSSHSWEDFFGGRVFGLTWLSVSGEGIYSYGKEQALETAVGGPDCSLAKKKNGESKCKGQKLWWMFVFKSIFKCKSARNFFNKEQTLVAWESAFVAVPVPFLRPTVYCFHLFRDIYTLVTWDQILKRKRVLCEGRYDIWWHVLKSSHHKRITKSFKSRSWDITSFTE